MPPFRTLCLAALTIAVLIALWPFYAALAIAAGLTAIGLERAIDWAIRRWR